MGNEPVATESPFDALEALNGALSAETITLSAKEENENEALLAELLKKDEVIAEIRKENEDFRARLFGYETEAQKAKDAYALDTLKAFLTLDIESLSPAVQEVISKQFFAQIGKQLEDMTLAQIMNLSKGSENV